ncbi:hypothetical protein [Belnapia rosea]|uniref:Uncharacterized protein n=1 Tax=Belnapia rosea TaxID=938405 RepID=A0A1G6P1J5_9PROT|nr:hypothetical protein [Belnapia rosea]SDC74033.1 hypothetical protein SAMN04487779_1002236 [Belnapia rosea]
MTIADIPLNALSPTQFDEIGSAILQRVMERMEEMDLGEEPPFTYRLSSLRAFAATMLEDAVEHPAMMKVLFDAATSALLPPEEADERTLLQEQIGRRIGSDAIDAGYFMDVVCDVLTEELVFNECWPLHPSHSRRES